MLVDRWVDEGSRPVERARRVVPDVQRRRAPVVRRRARERDSRPLATGLPCARWRRAGSCRTGCATRTRTWSRAPDRRGGAAARTRADRLPASSASWCSSRRSTSPRTGRVPVALLLAGSALVLALRGGRDRLGRVWRSPPRRRGAGPASSCTWQHTVLLAFVGLAGAVARDAAERLVLWRVQLSVLYGVAAVAKLNASFLGGDVLAGSLRDGPLPVSLPLPALLVAGVGVVLLEALLAVAPWVPRFRRPALGVAVCCTSARWSPCHRRRSSACGCCSSAASRSCCWRCRRGWCGRGCEVRRCGWWAGRVGEGRASPAFRPP